MEPGSGGSADRRGDRSGQAQGDGVAAMPMTASRASRGSAVGPTVPGCSLFILYLAAQSARPKGDGRTRR
jgi:hypothetical protein